jgi:hypothetical protein
MIKEKKTGETYGSKAAEIKHEKSEGKMERMKEYGSMKGKRDMGFCKGKRK